MPPNQQARAAKGATGTMVPCRSCWRRELVAGGDPPPHLLHCDARKDVPSACNQPVAFVSHWPVMLPNRQAWAAEKAADTMVPPVMFAERVRVASGDPPPHLLLKPGRMFLRRLIDLLRSPSATRDHHHIQLNKEFWANLCICVRVAIFPSRPGRNSMLSDNGCIVHLELWWVIRPGLVSAGVAFGGLQPEHII